MSFYRRFILSSASISACALLSRILGYFRDLIILNWVGIGFITDAYVLSTKFPSLFRKVISDGSMNSLLIPLLKDMHVKKIDTKLFISSLMRKFIKFIVVIVLIFLLTLKPIAQFIFPKLSSESISYFVMFSRFIFPSLIFMGLSSIWMSFLNYHKKFFVCAISSVVCNIFAIAILLLSYKFKFSFIFIGIAILFGNIAQFLWVFFNIKRNNLFSSEVAVGDIFSEEMQSFRGKLMNISFSSGVTQIMILFSSWAVSFLPAGNISYLAFADRVMQVPLSLIGISLSTTFLFYIAQYIKNKEMKQAKLLYKNTLQFVFFASVIISLLISYFSFFICKLLFFRGKITLIDVSHISFYLKIYILSIPAYSVSKIINAVFFAYGDTKTPLKGAVVQCVSNIILVPSLFFLGSLGVSLAFAMSSWAYALYLYCMIVMRMRKNYFVCKSDI